MSEAERQSKERQKERKVMQHLLRLHFKVFNDLFGKKKKMSELPPLLFMVLSVQEVVVLLSCLADKWFQLSNYSDRKQQGSRQFSCLLCFSIQQKGCKQKDEIGPPSTALVGVVESVIIMAWNSSPWTPLWICRCGL